MEKWRRVLRVGILPQLSSGGLRALASALRRDDPQLIQGAISCPSPLLAWRECQVAGACAIGYCGWHGDGLHSVGAIEEYFHFVCDAADAASTHPGACRYFLNWFDDTPRALMSRALLAEVMLALTHRRAAAA